MSYPFVGLTEVWPQYDKWDAAAIEQALRDGRFIYFEVGEGGPGVARFQDGKFQYVFEMHHDSDKVRFESESFLEFAAWIAFYGRDIL